mgnify:CR=1 FL=1
MRFFIFLFLTCFISLVNLGSHPYFQNLKAPPPPEIGHRLYTRNMKKYEGKMKKDVDYDMIYFFHLRLTMLRMWTIISYTRS